MRTLLRLSAILCLFSAPYVGPAHAQITWGASNTHGLGDAAGIELPIGDLVQIGTFNLTDSEIQQAQSDLGKLTAAFVPFGAALIGDDVGIPAYWNKKTSGSTDALGLNGKQIYLWAFNAPTPAQATQQGIYTAKNSPRWLFPSDSDIPSTTTVDVDDINDIIVGGFGNGTSSVTHSSLFNLAVVPEPTSTSVAFLVLCALTTGALRSKRIRAAVLLAR